MTGDLSPEQTVFNHVGICVTDLDRSKRFYQEVLQFRYWWELDAPDEGTSQLLEIPPPVGLHAVYLVRDGLVLADRPAGLAVGVSAQARDHQHA